MEKEESTTSKAPWRNRFLNIIERTIIELNIEFNNYSIGQTANGQTRKRLFDSSVQGIEFADELTVCSAIVNDCLASPIMNGDIEQATSDKEAELKFYRIEREVRYFNDARDRVDITAKRVSQEEIIKLAGGILSKEQVDKIKDYETSYIEAKRAKRYKNSTLSQNQIESYQETFGELRVGMQHKLDNYSSLDKFFYILVWGVWNNDAESENIPENYLKELLQGANFKINEDDRKIRWIPLSWHKNEELNPPKEVIIEKWCWILLAQLTKKN